MDVPKPTLNYEDAGGGAASLSGTLTVRVANVNAAGKVQDPRSFASFGVLTYRQQAAGGPLECWDMRSKSWVTDPGPNTDSIQAIPLAFEKDGGTPWRAVLATASPSAPQFEPENLGFPTYAFKARFVDKSQVSTLSQASDPVAFKEPHPGGQLYVGPGDGETAANATKAKFELHDGSGNLIGGLLIDGQEITLSNSAGAQIKLHSNGRVEIAGDLTAQHISYLPISGQPRTDL